MADFDETMDSSVEPDLLDKYGVLLRNLESYFPTEDDPEDKSEVFIREYRLMGESNIRFAGVEEQLKTAIKRHGEFSRVLNSTMGYQLTPLETHEYMVDLYNRLTGTDETRIRAQKDPDALMDYYVKRPMRIPFNVPYFGKEIPLWLVLVTALLWSSLAWLGYTFIPVAFIKQIFMVLLVIGTVATLAVSLAMYFLRDEVMNADKYEDRRIAIQEYREAKKKKNSASRWRMPLRRG